MAPVAHDLKLTHLWATFRNILLVVVLIFGFAVLQMFMFLRVCESGMKTASSLERQGLPNLDQLASLQEHIALFRLYSYEYLFAQETERTRKANAADQIEVQIRSELEKITVLLPEGEGRRLAAELAATCNDLALEFNKVRSLVESDFSAAMKALDQDIPSRIQRVTEAANQLKIFGYQFSGNQAKATFNSFGWIKKNAVLFGSGNIAVAFGAVIFVMIAARRSRSQLSDALVRLDERSRELASTNMSLKVEIEDHQRTEANLAQLHKQLLTTSHQAGMAEVATSVLHNVGNVLNSVNVSANLVTDQIARSKTSNLTKIATMLTEHSGHVIDFLANDSKGRQIPGYIGILATELTHEQQSMAEELGHLRKNIDHIKDIVAMQQSYAVVSGVVEMVPVSVLVEDAIRMNASSINRHGLELVRDYQCDPTITIERHKLLQILVNLIRNAKHACDDADRPDKRLTLRITQQDAWVLITVSDNGVGIPAENLTRIFNHGFTTRKTGHGFGLHSGALAAKNLGGTLTVQSDGPGTGASFILKVPLQPPAS